MFLHLCYNESEDFIMFLTKNTPLELFDGGDTIFIDKDVSLNGKILELLCIKFPNSKITISNFTEVISSSI